MNVKVLIITGDGVNCELETARAFNVCSAETTILHINQLECLGPDFLKGYNILALPGGFSFGDELGSGKVFSLKLKSYLKEGIKDFVADKKPVIGICNGFQVLTKLGLLSEEGKVGLAQNESGHFINQWSTLKVETKNCIWLKDCEEFHLPIRHGEGRLKINKDVSGDDIHVALTYSQNPNGSDRNIAGLTDETGLVLGLMPHPEAAIKETLYPGGVIRGSIGLKIFENAVNFCR